MHVLSLCPIERLCGNVNYLYGYGDCVYCKETVCIVVIVY